VSSLLVDPVADPECLLGSDVSGLKCTATKTEDGKHWIINGTKKWITNVSAFSLIFHSFQLTLDRRERKGFSVI
jgi:alkylation response protein AidB-like acyl-CoA dehydrogenase